jgi:hypothetical protein
MFRSQVIKCYELPYCTLEILAPDQFRLSIESLDQALEPTFELSSDHAQLLPLAKTLQQYWQSVTPPVTDQQEREPLYPVPFLVNDQSYLPKLSWGQLADLVKIFELYQTDLKKNPTAKRNCQKYIVSFTLLLSLGIIGGVITRVNINRQSLPTAIQPSQSPSKQATSASPSAAQKVLSVSPAQLLAKKQLKLSKSLEALEQLSPPSSVTAPSAKLSRNLPKLTPPKPIPEPPVTSPQQQLPVATFPEANHLRKPVNVTPTPQPETLFDQTPQLAEIRNYFQSRWEPPANLKQDLEYQMIINANGSLEKITPLGRVAQTHWSTLPLPQANQHFVSPSPRQAKQKIRLVLRANGQINTFLIRAKAISGSTLVH